MHLCSQCQSPRVVQLSLAGSQARSLGLSTFTILGYEKCLACGSVSEMAAPRWAWGIGLALGLGLVGLWVFALANGVMIHGFGLVLLVPFTVAASIRGLLRSKRAAKADLPSEPERSGSTAALAE